MASSTMQRMDQDLHKVLKAFQQIQEKKQGREITFTEAQRLFVRFLNELGTFSSAWYSLKSQMKKVK